MRRNGKIIALILVLCLAFSLLPVSALAKTIEKTGASTKFVDVDQDAWYVPYIDYVVDNGLMDGMSMDTFGPDLLVTRAQLVQALYALAGKPSVSKTSDFTDLEANWYKNAINWADANNVVAGYGESPNRTFRPNYNVSRQQTAMIFRAYAKNIDNQDINKAADLSAYKDEDDISDYAVVGIKWAVKVGLMDSRSTTEKIIVPKGVLTRAELAVMLAKYTKEIVPQEVVKTTTTPTPTATAKVTATPTPTLAPEPSQTVEPEATPEPSNKATVKVVLSSDDPKESLSNIKFTLYFGGITKYNLFAKSYSGTTNSSGVATIQNVPINEEEYYRLREDGFYNKGFVDIYNSNKGMYVLIDEKNITIYVHHEIKEIDEDFYEGKKYVSLGDSVAAGFGPYNTTNRGFSRVDVAYPSIVSDSLGTELVPLARTGWRTQELRYMIDHSYKGDNYMFAFGYITDDLIEEYKPKFVEELTDADLVTIQIGSNDVMHMAEVYAKAVVEAHDSTLGKQLDKIESDNDAAAALLKILDLADSLGLYPQVAAAAVTGMEVGYKNFKTNWDAIIGDIYELNPDVQIVAVGNYNSFKKVRLTEAEVVPIGKSLDIIINRINNYIQAKSKYAATYTYADCMDVELYDIPIYSKSELARGKTYSIHPTPEGHKYIAQQVLNALPYDK